MCELYIPISLKTLTAIRLCPLAAADKNTAISTSQLASSCSALISGLRLRTGDSDEAVGVLRDDVVAACGGRVRGIRVHCQRPQPAPCALHITAPDLHLQGGPRVSLLCYIHQPHLCGELLHLHMHHRACHGLVLMAWSCLVGR